MIFNTWVFLVFATISLTLYWGVIPQKYKPHYLVVIGSIFYVYSVPAYLLLIVALGLVTYGIGKAMLRPGIDTTTKKRWLTLGCVLITGVLVAFKYTKFFATTVDQVAHSNILPIPSIVVPLAISFFTFEFVHVLVDIYYGKIETLDPLDFSVFTMFFPTLVAGPIKRYQSFAPQVRAIVTPPPERFMLNVYRVMIGLTKKTIIADSMNAFTTPIATPGDPFGRLDYWVAVIAYTIKIYFDFSGYSDIAIGLGGLLGVRIPENFDMPYRQRNITDFWNHWHVSLSTWIRDYVFIPLGGSRGKPLQTIVNLFIAMALSGLWHGAAFTFILWGLWHGMGLAIHRLWRSTAVKRFPALAGPSPALRYLSVAGTLAFVATGWILFAAPSLGNATTVFLRLFA
jgi:alginate O-acetyltransferase complex protein AlgI